MPTTHQLVRRAGILAAVVVLVTMGLAGLAPPALAAEVLRPPAKVSERIDAGFAHTCVVDDGGGVRCWGLNSQGQLGYGNSAVAGKERIGDDETPAAAGVVDLDGAAAWKVATGAYHSCAILTDYDVACWGTNTRGRLGSGSQDFNNIYIGDDEVPGGARVALGPTRTAKAITAGAEHTCVINGLDKVMCWGSNGSGQLGYGNGGLDIGDGETPGSVGVVDLGFGRTVQAIAAGDLHTCALMDNGHVFCWGSNNDGQLGYPNVVNVGLNDTPATAPDGDVDLGGMTAISITAGENHTCVQLENNKLRCWGKGADGALGTGSSANIGDDESPTAANAGHVIFDAADVFQANGGAMHTCAVLGDRTDVRCWGVGASGQLGVPNAGGAAQTPADIGPVDVAGETINAVTAAGLHTCAVNAAGQVRCWGTNQEGQIGHGLGSGVTIGDNETPGSISPIDLGGLIIPAPCPLVICAPAEPYLP